MAQLPQKHDWQVTLRNWIAGKDESDFECGLPGLFFDASWFGSDDYIYRTWITFEDLGRRIAKIDGVRIDPSCYLLDNIEKDDGIYMRLYDRVEPAAMAWLYRWDYPGNPYYQNEQVANRALVACMVDMMMAYDQSIEQGNFDYFSQTYGSAFATWAYVLLVCYKVSDDAIGPYQTALTLFKHAFYEQGSTGIQADMDIPVLIGAWLSCLTDDHREEARQYGETFFGRHFNQAGFVNHGGGFDPSYNGVSIKCVAWLAHLTQWDFVLDALAKMSKLKAHLTFPEPTDDGLYKFYGPSNMATATADGSSRDQHWTFGRDVAVSYMTDEAAYLRYTGRNLNAWDQPYGLKTSDEMLADIEAWTNRGNDPKYLDDPDATFGEWRRALAEKPKIWQPSWHLDIPQLEWDYYSEGFYGEAYTASVMEPFAMPPFEHDNDFIQQHGEDFVTWKLGGMGGAIHTGGLSWYPDRDNGGLCGLSGGSLAAFWTEKGGIGILGRGRGSQGPTPDTWDNISSWMVNHVWGADMAGNRASSARTKNPAPEVVIDNEDVMIIVSGVLSPTSITYKKVFHINKDGAQISLSTDNNPATGLDGCLYETLPLWLGDGYRDESDESWYPNLWVRKDELWEPMIYDDMEEDVEAFKIQRETYLTLIELETPQTVHLGPVWSTSYQRTRERGVPLHIDILETGSVRYTISGPYVHELRKA